MNRYRVKSEEPNGYWYRPVRTKIKMGKEKEKRNPVPRGFDGSLQNPASPTGKGSSQVAKLD